MGRSMTCLILALLLALPVAALADADGYWTSNADWYYHLSQYCGGAETMVPISLDGAETFEKYPCPVCVPGEAVGEIRAVVSRGLGEVVVRIPDSCMGNQWLGQENGNTYDASWEGGETYRALGDYLSGEVYICFLNDYQARGSAQASGSRPRVLGMNSELIMSGRHLAGAWYFIVRPGAILRDSLEMDIWPMYWRTEAYQLSMQDDTLICDYITSTQTEKLELKLDVEDTESKLEHSKLTGEKGKWEIHIDINRVMDVFVAEISRTAKENIPEAELIIGDGSGIPLTSHGSEGQDIYCCVLTEAELNALRTGAATELRARSLWPAYYFGTPYAIQYDEDRGWAIIDREGNRVVDFGTYEKIDRDGSDKTFRCVLPEEMRYIYLDGNTMEQVREERE